MKIIGEELERVTHFKCLGSSTKEECCVETELTVRMGPGWRNWKKCRGYCAQNDAYETDQTSNGVWGRNVGYNEAKENWNQINEMRWMYGMIRKDKIWNEHLITRDNESGAGFQEDH